MLRAYGGTLCLSNHAGGGHLRVERRGRRLCITDAAIVGATPRIFFTTVTIVDAEANPSCPAYF